MKFQECIAIAIATVYVTIGSGNLLLLNLQPQIYA